MVLLHTWAIPHILRVRWHQNCPNCPILTMLNLRSTCARFCEKGFIITYQILLRFVVAIQSILGRGRWGANRMNHSIMSSLGFTQISKLQFYCLRQFIFLNEIFFELLGNRKLQWHEVTFTLAATKIMINFCTYSVIAKETSNFYSIDTFDTYRRRMYLELHTGSYIISLIFRRT